MGIQFAVLYVALCPRTTNGVWKTEGGLITIPKQYSYISHHFASYEKAWEATIIILLMTDIGCAILITKITTPRGGEKNQPHSRPIYKNLYFFGSLEKNSTIHS